MKDTPGTRDRLRGLIAKGAEAESLLKQLDPKFVQIRELYRGSLVQSIRSKAEDREIVLQACRIAALEDLYEQFYSEARTGARAQKAATELESE